MGYSMTKDMQTALFEPAFGQPPHRAARSRDLSQKQSLQPHPETRNAAIDCLAQILADSITLGNLYATSHTQKPSSSSPPLRQIFHTHYAAQLELVFQITSRIQLLGGTSLLLNQNVAAQTLIPNWPRDMENPPSETSRLLHAHQIIIVQARAMATAASRHGDYETSALLLRIVTLNEKQVLPLFMFVTQKYRNLPSPSPGTPTRPLT